MDGSNSSTKRVPMVDYSTSDLLCFIDNLRTQFFSDMVEFFTKVLEMFLGTFHIWAY